MSKLLAPTNHMTLTSVNFSSKYRAAILGVAALAIWILLFCSLPENLPLANDLNSYLGGAAAIRAGHGYRFEPYIDLPRIGMYPPGYAMWLALFWKNDVSFATNFYRLEIANWIAAGVTLFTLAACLFSCEMPTFACSAILMLFGTSVLFTQLAINLLSDIVFTAGSCILALLIAAYDRHWKPLMWWLVAGLLASLLYLEKTMALAYIIGLGSFGLLRGDFRHFSRMIAFCLPTGSVVVAWFLLTRNIPTYGTFFTLRIAEFGGWAGYFLNVVKQAILYCSGRWLVEALFT